MAHSVWTRTTTLKLLARSTLLSVSSRPLQCSVARAWLSSIPVRRDTKDTASSSLSSLWMHHHRDQTKLSFFPEINNNNNHSMTNDIEDLHQKAVQQGSTTYVDPHTGFTVFTELSHLKRGKCCGNRCRHCPYGWVNVVVVDVDKTTTRPEATVSSSNGVAVRERLEQLRYKNDDESAASSSSGSSNARHSLLNDDEDHELVDKHDGVRLPPPGRGGRHGGKHTSKNVPYTRHGDKGTSQLLTGERRSKDDCAFEAMGTVDELCSIVGLAHAELTNHNGKYMTPLTTQIPNPATIPEWLLEIMSRLFDVGSHVAKPKRDESSSFTADGVGGGFHFHHVEQLEDWIDALTEQLPELTSFILPTGSVAAAQLHVARTVCRRAERRVVGLVEAGVCDPNALRYLNRLSDFFFVAARWANLYKGQEEIWYRRETRTAKQRNRHSVSLQAEREDAS